MFVCPQCNVENRSNAKFCRKCGQPRAELECLSVTQPPVESAPRPNALREEPAAVVTINQGPMEPVGQSEGAIDEAVAPECPSCWTVLRATDKFCCWCGSAQPNRIQPFMKLCLECNTQLPEKANFCFSCGADVSTYSRLKVRAPLELFKDEDSEFFPRFEA